MMHLLLPYWKLLPIALALFTGLWVVSIFKKDASIIDIFWSLGFFTLYAIQFFNAEYSTLRGDLVFLLLAMWAVRLSIYLFLRNFGRGEDPRYQKMRAKFGAGSFWWKSIFVVFFLQATILWIVAAPVLWLPLFPQPSALTWLDALGVTLWAVGFLFESIADYQMAKFKAAKNHAGKVCSQGLWGISRHPNYFGEALVWWGFYAIACNVEGGAYTLFAPLLLTYLLLRVSGVTLLEQQLLSQKPAYRDYIRDVPAFFPRLWKR